MEFWRRELGKVQEISDAMAADLRMERDRRKWTSWSAHFAWGAAITLALLLTAWPMRSFIALTAGVVTGVLWELGYWIWFRQPAARPSGVDLFAWVLGAVAAFGYSLLNF